MKIKSKVDQRERKNNVNLGYSTPNGLAKNRFMHVCMAPDCSMKRMDFFAAEKGKSSDLIRIRAGVNIPFFFGSRTARVHFPIRQ